MKPDWRYVVMAVVGLVVLGILAWQHVIHPDAVLTYLAGVFIPALKGSSNEPK